MYYLAADNESEMSRWIEGLCQVCGLKMIEDDNDGSIGNQIKRESYL